MLFGFFGWFGAESSSAVSGRTERDGVQMEERKVKRRRRKIEQNGHDHVDVDLNNHFPGMVNLSGTLCYMNSVLQAFASITSLVNHLEKIVELAVETDTPTPVTDALLEVIQDLNTPHSRSPPLRPHSLLQALHPLPQIRRLLSTREQQDAHELFIILAEAVSDEAMKVASEIGRLRGLGEILSLQGYAGSKNLVGGNADLEGANKRRKVRGIAQPWEGLMARRRVCQTCGWETEVRMDLVGGMELPIPLHGDVSLDSCLAEYLSPEYLSDVTCEACSLRTSLTYYQNEVERLSSTPSSSTAKPAFNANAKTEKSSSAAIANGSGAFSALEGLSTLSTSTKEEKMTNSRKKRAREARRVENRLKEMLDSNVISNFNEPTLEPLHRDREGEGSGSASIPIKWQISRTQSIRQSILTRPPQSLRMLFIRSEFTPYGSVLKKTARVNFPVILDLTRFVSDGVWEEKQPNTGISQAVNGIDGKGRKKRIFYRLESVILHYGYTHSSGHFICIRRKPSPPTSNSATTRNANTDTSHKGYRPEKVYKSCSDECACESCVYFGKVRDGLGGKGPGKGWLRISDADVEEVGEEALWESRGAVFMLFYERVGEYRGGGVKGEKREVAKGNDGEEKKELNNASVVI
ncbi:hypothetical protein I302_105942 [Kwoniella bestiolae CBS 10118]|uniref:ubiquitinyl hydrolase 1 n=1 Tax=Kwoniella bestiolae CBS 10118 TaxID=1296100 RepID=A0A1B9G2K3_9TREE|nr:hypothetical protein I302_05066 [Kwoniella bestiolae CBS 10118]OCF25253.1 hypothetical protein I302_05066 [Kwoniella bestiolae CBS 10118]